MLDKDNKHNIDEQFAHESWLNMQSILDKEMPVKRKRRSFFWLWLMSGVILLLVVGLWWMQSVEGEQDTTPNELQTQAIVENGEADNKEITKKDNNIITDSTLPKKNAQNQPQLADNTNFQKTNSSAKKNDDLTSILENNKSESHENSLSTVSHTTPSIVAPKDNTTSLNNNLIKSKSKSNASDDLREITLENEVDANKKLKSQTSIADHERKVIEAAADSKSALALNKSDRAERSTPYLSFLSTLPPARLGSRAGSLNELSTNFEFTPKLNIPIVDLPNNSLKRFRWGVEAGVQSNYINAIDGGYAGVFATYHFHPKWSISGGFRYSLFKYGDKRTKLESLNSFDDAEVTIDPGLADTTGIGTPSNPTMGAENISKGEVYSILTNEARFQALQLPIQIDYRLSRKWSIGTGLQVTYLLNGLVKTQPVLNSRFQVLDSNKNTYFNLAIDETIARKWDLSTMASIQFHPFNKWSFGLDYNLVLFNSKNELNKVSLQNNSVRLGVKYFIK